jgi:uroporphyrinogen decarboxylase
LKLDFGKDVTFWGGGFVFNTVHNIQSDVTPGNIMAMWEALQKYGVY